MITRLSIENSDWPRTEWTLQGYFFRDAILFFDPFQLTLGRFPSFRTRVVYWENSLQRRV